MRLLIRIFRRAGIEMIYSRGFHPKPLVTFAPALGLGIAALGELCDVRIEWPGGADELGARLGAVAPEGLRMVALRALGANEPPLSRVLSRADYAALVPDELPPLRAADLVVSRVQKGKRKPIDVGRWLVGAAIADADEAARLRGALDWPAGGVVTFGLRVGTDGGAKPAEVIEALTGRAPEGARYARLALWGAGAGGELLDPMAPPLVDRGNETPVFA
jgi:radical SAM-linked protein